MRKENVTSIGETNIMFVGGDVPGAPFKTPTANPTSIAETDDLASLPLEGKGDRVPPAEHLWIEVFGEQRF